MSKFRRFAILVLIFELLLCATANILWFSLSDNNSGAVWRVEASRIAFRLEKEQLSDINPEDYSTITRVSVYNPDEICNSDYLVLNVGGTLYRFEYETASSPLAIVFINASFALLLLVTLGLFLYIGVKVLKPFASMNSLTADLASGNLSVPVKEDKSRYFGRFLWGVNMLRDKLERTRVHEIELQRERKTLILSLSHDIKTPLSAIELYDRALSENLYDSDEKKKEAYDAILANSEQIRHYVSDIAAAAREDFLEFDVTVGEIYLSSVIDKIRAYYSDRLPLLHTDFVIDKYSDCLLKADRDRLIEVIQNVMENAIKYGDGVDIRISFDEEEGCRLIYVENSGCTMKEEEMTNIFIICLSAKGTNGVMKRVSNFRF